MYSFSISESNLCKEKMVIEEMTMQVLLHNYMANLHGSELLLDTRYIYNHDISIPPPNEN